MKLINAIFYEPESISALFLLTNFVILTLSIIVLQSWPLSLISTAVYLTLVYKVTRWLAVGRQYIPTKDLTGQTVIVTGAATGIGRVTALEIAKLGARVIIGVRGQERAERIAEELKRESNGGYVIGHDLDLSSLENIKEFTNKIDKVDILINNAGTIVGNYSTTTDGIETQFGTNYGRDIYIHLKIKFFKQRYIFDMFFT